MTGRRTPEGEQPSDEPSLDPRTWLGPRQAAGDAPPPAESFDPRSWIAPTAPSAEISRPPAWVSRRSLIIGGAAAGAGLLGAGYLIWRGRKGVLLEGAGASAADLANPDGDTYTAPAVTGYAGLAQRLANYGIAPAEARKAVGALGSVAGPDPGRMRLMIRLRSRPDGASLLEAELRRTQDGIGYRLLRQGDGFVAARLSAGLARHLVAHPRGQVNRDGLYASAVDTISPDLMTQFAEALAFDFDIAQEVREGDQFEIVHEEQDDARGNVVGEPKLLFAFMSAGGKDRYLYRFKPPGGEEAWFDDRGRNIRRAFMRTPLDGARITSLFGERKHPVLAGLVRNHNGVDFGCPVGTRVFAAARGVVEYAGSARGFGMLLKLRHEGGLGTWYGHLSGLPDGIIAGVSVVQGQVVALSGNTGVSSGPHLHYEVHKDGLPVDPKDFLDVQGAASGAAVEVLTGGALDAFLEFKNEIDLARSQA